MHSPLALEDEAEDIVSKAARGLGTSAASLSGLPLSETAGKLGLDARALEAVAAGDYRPEVAAPDGLEVATTRWGGSMLVNAYVVWDAAARLAVAFDTGATAEPLRDILVAHGLSLRALFLTHTHPDHIADLEGVPAPAVYAPAAEPVPGATAVPAGATFEFGALTISARPTPGHSEGGTTYVVGGLSVPVAIVGDAIFAGSMGGVAGPRYAGAVRAVREQILGLPEETVLCPGHGPLTTVGLEKAHNPFFAAS